MVRNRSVNVHLVLLTYFWWSLLHSAERSHHQNELFKHSWNPNSLEAIIAFFFFSSGPVKTPKKKKQVQNKFFKYTEIERKQLVSVDPLHHTVLMSQWRCVCWTTCDINELHLIKYMRVPVCIDYLCTQLGHAPFFTCVFVLIIHKSQKNWTLHLHSLYFKHIIVIWWDYTEANRASVALVSVTTDVETLDGF